MAYNGNVKREATSRGPSAVAPDPVVTGVYFLFLEDKLTYVGKSRDCYRRIAQHRTNGRPFDIATVMPIAAELMHRVETALIQGFQPPQNVTHTESLRSSKVAWRLSRPTEKRELREIPARNGLGTVSRQAARDIAVAHGLPSALIDAAISDGRLTFVDSGKIGPRSKKPVLVALYDDVVAFCERGRFDHLAALGLGKLSAECAQEVRP